MYLKNRQLSNISIIISTYFSFESNCIAWSIRSASPYNKRNGGSQSPAISTLLFSGTNYESEDVDFNASNSSTPK